MTLKRTVVMQPRWHSGRNGNPQAAIRLFCFPYAGGAASIFRMWQRSFPLEVEVLPVELPGRGTRWKEPLILRLELLVESAAASIFHLLDKPYIFFGHSMGALLSYELARYIRKQHGIEPTRLIVSGCPAPHLVGNREKYYDLPDQDFLRKVKAFNGTPQEVLEDTELMQLLLPTLRADFAVFDTYGHQPSVPLTCSITSLGGSEDPEVSIDELLGWQRHTTACLDLHMFPGDHFFINSRQNELLCLLARKLEEVTESSGVR